MQDKVVIVNQSVRFFILALLFLFREVCRKKKRKWEQWSLREVLLFAAAGLCAGIDLLLPCRLSGTSQWQDRHLANGNAIAGRR